MRVLKNLLKFYRTFRKNLGKVFENLGNMHFYAVSRAELAKLFKKLFEKSMETCKILKMRVFLLEKAIFNNNKGEVGGLLELINNPKRNEET